MDRGARRHIGFAVLFAGAILVGVPGALLAANPPQAASKPAAAPKAPAPAPTQGPAPTAAPAAPAYDIDTPAQFLDQLFREVCIPNYDAPDRVRAYALGKHFAELKSPQAVSLFVGQGNGAAWAVPSSLGAFVLSIRGQSQGCAVWAREAEPLAVETYFRARVESVTTPGTEAFLDRDSTVPTGAGGTMRAMVYNVTEPDAWNSIQLLLLAGDKPGGAFQASFQIQKFGKRVPPLVAPRSATDN